MHTEPFRLASLKRHYRVGAYRWCIVIVHIPLFSTQLSHANCLVLVLLLDSFGTVGCSSLSWHNSFASQSHVCTCNQLFLLFVFVFSVVDMQMSSLNHAMHTHFVINIEWKNIGCAHWQIMVNGSSYNHFLFLFGIMICHIKAILQL